MLTIRRVNPLDYTDSLKSLFAANEMQALVPRFDAASSELVRNGGASWIGLDDTGHVHLHVTLVRQDFEFRGRMLRGGTLGNLVASRNYRFLFPSASLVSRLIKDVSASSQLDFLYTDPPPLAAAVSKAAGLKRVGTMTRFIIPLGDSRPLHALAARAYATAIGLRIGFTAASCTAIDSTEKDVDCFALPIETSSRLRARHTASTYRRRLRGYPGPDYAWCEFRLRADRRRNQPDAAVLLYGPDEKRIAHVWAIRRESDVALPSLIPGLVRAARARGAQRLQIETVRESDFAAELLRIGFRKRDDLVPVYGAGITPAGHDVMDSIREWELTAFDMER